MIKTIKSKKLANFYFKGVKQGIDSSHLKRVKWILDILDVIEEVEEIKSLGLHKLSGNLNGYWSLKVSANWRIIFRCKNGNVYDVDYLDYH